MAAIAVRRAVHVTVSTLVALLALLLLSHAAHAADGSYAAAEQQMVDKINAERRAQGMPALAVDVELTRVARAWTPEMVERDGLAHNPNLSSEVNADWQRLAENVGRSYESGASDARLVERLHDAFMGSDGHRRNILSDTNRVGVGITRDGADGMMYATVVFMKTGQPAHANTIDEATRISHELFDGDAEHVVLARSEVFADALGGAGLAADVGPILFTPGPRSHDPDPVLHPTARGEIDRALGGSGRVYLLGGSGAVSARTERELASAGYEVRRLAGGGRVETAVAVADEIARVHGAPDAALVVRADEWPDAVSGGAWAARTRSPVLLTPSDDLHGAPQAFLDRNGVAGRYALGGTAALSDRVVQAADATRVAGSERSATAVAVAHQLWGRTSASDGDRYATAPSHGHTAWASALALAPWSARHDAPQLLVADSVPPSVRGYLDQLGYDSDAQGDVFASRAVPDPVVDELRALVR